MATSKASAAKVAATSETEKQPYMSEYDKSVELRLQALESKAHTPCNGGGSVDVDRLAALEAKVEDLMNRLARKMSF